MMKRNLFIVLAGIITAGAVLGWCRESGQVAETNAPAPKIVSNTPGKSYHEAVLSLLNANDKVAGAEMQVLAANRGDVGTDAAPAIRLVSPSVGPSFVAAAPQKPQAQASTLDLLKNSDFFKDARAHAMVNLAEKSVIESSTDVQLDVESEAQSGTQYVIRDGKLALAAWSCFDESRTECLYGLMDSHELVDAGIRCDVANQSFVRCGADLADSFALFDASECTRDEAYSAIQAALASQAGDSGTIEAGGKKWSYVRAKLQSGCELASIAPIISETVAAPAHAAVSGQPKRLFSLKVLVMAVISGVIVFLLGVVCTRRKETEIETAPRSLKNDAQDGKSSLDAAEQEKAALLKKLEGVQAQAKESADIVERIKEELESARAAFKKEEISRLSLEEENRRLEDALAARPTANTVVDSPVHFTKNGSKSNLPLKNDKETSEIATVTESTAVRENATNRVTTPVDTSNLEMLQTSEKTSSFFDELTDGGWDEIAESFDAIFTPSGDKTEISDHNELSDFGLPQRGAGEPNSVFDFLNEVKTSSSPTWKSVPQTDEPPKKEEPRGRHVITAEYTGSSSPGGASSDGFRGNTMKLQAMKKEAGGKPDLADIQPIPNLTKRANTLPDIVKAQPSWTMKGVAALENPAAPKKNSTQVDENSLYEALKRRAKDVSEMDMPAVGAPKSSGAFEFTPGISKSGLFTVTGSRVDIDPLSETEYFKSLYDKYVQTQKECGEVTDKFTLEQFVSRLAREKDRLMKTYKCKNVRFSVYVKDGKASLKATPQK